MPDNEPLPELEYKPNSGWTVATALMHIEAMLIEMDKRYEQRFEAEQTARELAWKEMDRRLTGMNEIREQLNLQANTFMSKAEYNAHHDVLVQRQEFTTSRLDKLEARREGISANIGWVIGIIGVVASVVTAIWEIIKR